MELKTYQKAVLSDLKNYLKYLNETQSLSKAFAEFWMDKQVQVGLGEIPEYQNIIEGVPHLCYKVPTGGGKTFLACASLKPIMQALPPQAAQAVVWLVPSDAILTQTLRALKDPSHPYRQYIDKDFSGRVEVYSKEELLSGQNFSPATVAEQLSIMVLSYDSFRSNKKEGRKAYQANGALEPFRGKLAPSASPIAEADETALYQIINQLNPVVIVDESHHARSTLSKEMLKNFNPAFVLDLTATPKEDSNIISYVGAYALKQESMVKLPVIVYNRNSKADVVGDAIDLRNALEQHAIQERKAGGDYIRPIVLFQAEPKAKESATTFEKLKNQLIELGIPAQEIAIKTAEVDELKGANLLDQSCPIRYIITINALKEGWDCPFAYILASLTNKTSSVDVEQIVGRILRQPHARRHNSELLNLSFVFTSSADFQQTLSNVVKGLNNAGFSGKDYRVPSELPQNALEQSLIDGVEITYNPSGTHLSETLESESAEGDEGVLFNPGDVHLTPIAADCTEGHAAFSPTTQFMMEQAIQTENSYQQDIEMAVCNGEDLNTPAEVQSSKDLYPMCAEFAEDARSLKLPQFCYQEAGGFLSEDSGLSWKRVTPEYLSEEFKLLGLSTHIDVSRTSIDLMAIDIEEKNDTPKAFQLNEKKQHELLIEMDSKPSEEQIEMITSLVFDRLSRQKFTNVIPEKDLKKYVRRVIEDLDEQQLKQVSTGIYDFTEKISEKINSFLCEYRKERLNMLLNTNKVRAIPRYSLPHAIALSKKIDHLRGSLYEAEGDVNADEERLIMKIDALDNVVWWHRIPSRTGFWLNGAINHYPDLMVRTKRGNTVLIESKGYQLANDDSRRKIVLGKQWEQAAGQNFKYFMVFPDSEQNEPLPGAYQVSKFLEQLKLL